MGEDLTICVRDEDILDIRLLGRLHEQLLYLESTPTHAHHTGPRACLKRPNECGSLFHKQSNGVFFLLVDGVERNEDKYGQKNKDCP
jgi:hypothetical protein